MALEPEEAVGRFWHRLVGERASYPHHPDAAVALDAVRGPLAVFFRGLGGARGVRVAACGSTSSAHRLSLRQRLGLGAERAPQPRFDGDTLLLPERIDYFADARLNERLYLWLAAFFAHAAPCPPLADDPLQADIGMLRFTHQTTLRALRDWPGLRPVHAELARALREVRPHRRLHGWEAAVEETILHLLGGDPPHGTVARRVRQLIVEPDAAIASCAAPRDYRPFLPVPLWGELSRHAPSPRPHHDEAGGGGTDAQDGKQHRARRRRCDQAARRDSLILTRFESILSLGEMADVNRSVEDDEADAAREAADQLDEIVVTDHPQSAATRLRLDLDLAPAPVQASVLAGEHTYPEWDCRRQCYLPGYCRVIAAQAGSEGEDWRPDAAARRRIRAVRRQFEALRPRRIVLPAQSDGHELDLAAVVRSRVELKAGGAGSERVYLHARNGARDLAVAVLVDVSLSTDSWIDNHRVLDVEKEAVVALTHGLAACGDDHAVFAFTSRSPAWVSVQIVKDFDELPNAAIERRIEALRPGYYTRMGAALRYTTERLARRPNRRRLVIVLTDGKPNDVDHYEGRYGVEDTRKAVRDARRQGLAVFGITVDRKARDYFPYLFGRGAYAIVGRIARLPAALPMIYRQLAG